MRCARIRRDRICTLVPASMESDLGEARVQSSAEEDSSEEEEEEEEEEESSSSEEEEEQPPKVSGATRTRKVMVRVKKN